MNKVEITNLIKELIEKIADLTNEVAVFDEEHKDGTVTTWFKVEVKDPHVYIGRDGEALMALNHLARRIVESKIPREIGDKENTNGKNNFSFLIDINGHQKKKIESLHAMAHMMAERARYFKSSMEIDPMGAFERRIVHEFLSDARDLKTESEGVGPSRRVVIKYIGEL
ncbi:MAG: hypothetical protein KBD52_00705 [Candidatus Pacebacteria bacterium]|nr:hypothetical protein [Candidatus Paceibacterota bacterium]